MSLNTSVDNTNHLEQKIFTFNPKLDVDFLESSYNNRLNLCSQLFGVFLENAREDWNSLIVAAGDLNYEAISRICHKCKNNFKYVGLGYLSDQLGEMEDLAKKESSDLLNVLENIKGRVNPSIEIVKLEEERLRNFLAA